VRAVSRGATRGIYGKPGKVLTAWTETPVTWYPIPIAVGALVLVAIQYRRKSRKEVHVDEDGNEVIRLKGPWQVSL
jgi:phosphatidylserine decarboxylase